MVKPSRREIEERIAAVPHWHQVIRLGDDVATPGAYDPATLLERIALGDLSGKRVLDVGTCDGYFAFACEALGAEVLAIDHKDLDVTGFAVARDLLDSKVEYVQTNVYDVSPDRFGHFDVVLFLGVLYHLRHPLLALDRLRGVCRSELVVESLVCDEALFTGYEEQRPLRELDPDLADLPIAQFLPAGRFHSDLTNKWVPNTAALEALIRDAAFVPTETIRWLDRALVRARASDDPETEKLVELDRGLRHVT